jgi:hypothetical protein
LRTGLKVRGTLQWSPCVSLKLRFSHLLLPPSLPPLLLLCCTPPPAPGPERRPAALRPLRLAPRIDPSLLPPPAVPALAAPCSSTSGRQPERPPRRPVKHAGAARRSVSGCVIFPLPSSSFLRPCGAIKVDRATFSPVAWPLPPPHGTEPLPLIFPGILPNRNTPLRFRWPRAFSPPPLAPQLDPIHPRPSPSPDLPYPEPPSSAPPELSLVVVSTHRRLFVRSKYGDRLPTSH